MKKALLMVLLLSLLTCALSEGVTLRTASCFAGEDAAAISYVELLRAYEERTGNVVEDESATSDESWKSGVLSDFAVGNEPDVLFFFACSGDSAPILRRVVPIAEINAAYPELDLAQSESLREADGDIYAIPARPRTAEEVPESWLEGMALIRRLYELGAFPGDAMNTSEAATSQLFRDKRAAMQFDGSWFANTIPEANMDTTRVLPVPVAGGDGGAVIGGVSMGFYLTRRAWDDPLRRDAAVELLAWLTAPENLARLSAEQTSGALRESAQALLENAGSLLGPVQDDMNKAAREAWLLECVPAVAEGRMTPEECWQRVLAMEPFGF